MDDFKDYPPSITELRSEKTNSAKDWTPRDALIHVLRLIDNGEISPKALAVTYTLDGGGVRCTAASPYALMTVGMLNSAAVGVGEDGD